MEVSQRQLLIPQASAAEKQPGKPTRRPPTQKQQRSPPFSCILFSCLFGLMLIVVVATVCLTYRLTGTTRLDVKTLEVEKCPGCAGQSACPVFLRGDVKLDYPAMGASDDGLVAGSTLGCRGLPATFGLYETARRVHLHRLGSPANSSQVDAAVCRRGPQSGLASATVVARSRLTCIPHLAIWRWLPTHSAASRDDPPWYAEASVEGPLNKGLVMAPGLLAASAGLSDSVWLDSMSTVAYSPATRCASDRLFGHLQASFRERTSYGAETRWLRFDELMFLFNLAVDPTGLLSQAFPPFEGWPFPAYIGACGRWLVLENSGVPIDRFIYSPVWLRLRLLASILGLPDRLRHPPEGNGTTSGVPSRYSQSPETTTMTHGYTVYLTSIDFVSQLFVDPYTYNVTIADLRHVVVVDVLELSRMQPANRAPDLFSVPASAARHMLAEANSTRSDRTSERGDAGGSTPPCLTGQYADELCSHVRTDHNEWTVCAGLLLVHDWLLTDMPADQLVGQLQLCAHPGDQLTGSERLVAFEQARQLVASLVEGNPAPSW